jgi:hypothetical protein
MHDCGELCDGWRSITSLNLIPTVRTLFGGAGFRPGLGNAPFVA